MHRLIVPQKHKLNTFLATVRPTPTGVSETSLARNTMSIKIGDKIRYVVTSEDGEVCWCVQTLSGLRIGALCHLSTWLKRIGSRWSQVSFPAQWAIGDAAAVEMDDWAQK
jgi:hypothetical protein